MNITLFKFTNTVDGDEDPIFINAASENAARAIFRNQIGDMPDSMLKVEPVDALPDGFEAFFAGSV